MLEIITSDALPGTRHGFFTRKGGASSGIFAGLNCGTGSSDLSDAVAINRARVAQAMDLPLSHLVTVNQVHSADVVMLTAPLDPRPRADALVTATPGLGLAVLTADCQPVLFSDPQAGVIGAAHAGWRGSRDGVLEATLNAMEALGANRAAITAVIGPTISQAAYEVGPEFRERFTQADAANVGFFSPSRRQGHFMFDLPAYLANRLSAEGVGKVADLGLCTYADENRFFSYRRTTHRKESDYGRLISAIAIA